MPSRTELSSLLASADERLGRLRLLPGTSYCEALEDALREARRLLEGKVRLELTVPGLPRFVAFAGGTNVGKSSMFNLFLGRVVAGPADTAGATKCAVLHAGTRHRELLQHPALLPGYAKEPLSEIARANEHHARPTAFLSLDPGDPPWVLCDSPDVDSRLKANAEVGYDVLALADTLILVTTDQKYLDRRPLDFLSEARQLDKQLAVVVNKVEDPDKGRDIARDLRDKSGLADGEVEVYLVPFRRGIAPGGPGSEALDGLRRLLAQDPEPVKRLALAGAARGVARHLGPVLEAYGRESALAAEHGARLRAFGAERRREFERFARVLSESEFHELSTAIRRVLEDYGIPFVKDVVAAASQIASQVFGRLLPWGGSAEKKPPLEERRRKSFTEVLRHVEAAGRAWESHLRLAGERDELARAVHEAATRLPAADAGALESVHLDALSEREAFAAEIEDRIRAWLAESPLQRTWLQAFRVLLSGGTTALVVFLTGGGLGVSDLLWGPLAAMASEAVFRNLAPPQFFRAFRERFIGLELAAFDAVVEAGYLAPRLAVLPSGDTELAAGLKRDLETLARGLERSV